MIFGDAYAAVYDALYLDKDYDAECDVLERFFHAHTHPIRSVLDLGCGTGGHAVPLARRGFNVVGVDRSGAMLNHARDRAASLAPRGLVTFFQKDIRSAALGTTFDAVIMLFAVLSYQTSNRDALRALSTARRHLERGGLLIFDAWYGPAVLAQRPESRVKVIERLDDRLIRASTGSLDVRRQVCHVDLRIWRLVSDHLVGESSERHAMRYFFPRELELLLTTTSFRLRLLKGLPRLSRPDETTWNVLVVATAR